MASSDSQEMSFVSEMCGEEVNIQENFVEQQGFYLKFTFGGIQVFSTQVAAFLYNGVALPLCYYSPEPVNVLLDCACLHTRSGKTLNFVYINGVIGFAYNIAMSANPRCNCQRPAGYVYRHLSLPGVSIRSVSFHPVLRYASIYAAKLSGLLPYQIAPSSHRPLTYRLQVEAVEDVDALIKVFIGPRADDAGRMVGLANAANYLFLFDSFHCRIRQRRSEIVRYSQFDHCKVSKRRQVLPGDWKDTIVARQYHLQSTQFQLYFHIAPYYAPPGTPIPADFKRDRYLCYPMSYPMDRHVDHEWVYYSSNSYMADIDITY